MIVLKIPFGAIVLGAGLVVFVAVGGVPLMTPQGIMVTVIGTGVLLSGVKWLFDELN